jgi:hypothetical protein
VPLAHSIGASAPVSGSEKNLPVWTACKIPKKLCRENGLQSEAKSLISRGDSLPQAFAISIYQSAREYNLCGNSSGNA